MKYQINIYESTTIESNHKFYIENTENEDKGNTRAGSLAWLRYRLNMESSNGADHNTNVLDKQMVITSSITDHKENIHEQDVILWNEYKDYLDVKVRKITASNLFRYAKKYYYVLLTNNVSDLSLLTQEKRIHVMKDLSSPPSKFLGVHQKW
ncbi:MAG TPA: hypothetical protein VLE21_04675 [Candidatus Nitrosocosmicus sp.]|nr:hypothetical protein [Candidatus Nitrosocosmicus sp.]